MTVWFDKRQWEWRYNFVVRGVRQHGFCLD